MGFKSKDKELPFLVEKANKHWRISAMKVRSLDGMNKELVLEHAVGRGRGLIMTQALNTLGLRDLYLKKVDEIRKKWKGDTQAFEAEDEIWKKHYNSRVRAAFTKAIEEWKKFYLVQDLEPCATWIPTGDKDKGSMFSIWAMVSASSRKLCFGTDADYAKYLWVIKKQTQMAHDKNREITRDTQEYLKMGHAGKEVAHFLSQMVKGEIPSAVPPALGFEKK